MSSRTCFGQKGAPSYWHVLLRLPGDRRMQVLSQGLGSATISEASSTTRPAATSCYHVPYCTSTPTASSTSICINTHRLHHNTPTHTRSTHHDDAQPQYQPCKKLLNSVSDLTLSSPIPLSPYTTLKSLNTSSIEVCHKQRETLPLLFTPSGAFIRTAALIPTSPLAALAVAPTLAPRTLGRSTLLLHCNTYWGPNVPV